MPGFLRSRPARPSLRPLMPFALQDAAAPVAPAAAQWKPEIKFLKIGVSSAGGDWVRAGAKCGGT